MNVLSLLGMKIERRDKKLFGYILGISIDGDKIKYLICSDEGEREFFVKAESATYFNGRIIFEDKADKIKNAKTFKLGRGVYSPSGKFLGLLNDCDEENFTITKAYVGKRKINFDRLICGDIIILKDEDKQTLPYEQSNLSSPHEMFITALCS